MSAKHFLVILVCFSSFLSVAKGLRSLCRWKALANVSGAVSKWKVPTHVKNKIQVSSRNQTQALCVTVETALEKEYAGVMSRKRQLWLQYWLYTLIKNVTNITYRLLWLGKLYSSVARTRRNTLTNAMYDMHIIAAYHALHFDQTDFCALTWVVMLLQGISYPLNTSAVDMPGKLTTGAQLLHLHKQCINPPRNTWLKAKKCSVGNYSLTASYETNSHNAWDLPAFLPLFNVHIGMQAF